MSLFEEIKKWLEFEGTIVGDGTLSDRGVDIQVNETLNKDQIERMHIELNKVEYRIADTFEKKEELMRYITMQTKLRLLIHTRMKSMMKIPKEYVDKYNKTVTVIRDIIKAQEEKETEEQEEMS